MYYLREDKLDKIMQATMQAVVASLALVKGCQRFCLIHFQNVCVCIARHIESTFIKRNKNSFSRKYSF